MTNEMQSSKELEGLRSKALSVIASMTKAAPKWERPEYQAGYFDGLVAGYHLSGLLSDSELKEFRERMRAGLPPKKRAEWWNLAEKLGL